MLDNSGIVAPGLFRSRSLPQLLYGTDSGVGSFSDGGGGGGGGCGGGQQQGNAHRSQGDFKQLLTLKQHYYPEGGWGWVIMCCAIAVQTLTHGLQIGSGVLVRECVRKFGPGVTYSAGRMSWFSFFFSFSFFHSCTRIPKDNDYK